MFPAHFPPLVLPSRERIKEHHPYLILMRGHSWDGLCRSLKVVAGVGGQPLLPAVMQVGSGLWGEHRGKWGKFLLGSFWPLKAQS